MAGALPSDLLHAIFMAVQPSDAAEEGGEGPLSSMVLGFDDRVRAEMVCKHWRAALATLPWRFESLSISTAWPGAGWILPPGSEAAAAAAVSKAVGRARSLVARAPTATNVQLQVMYQLPPELLDAYLDALHILLSRPDGGRSFSLTACTSAQADAEAALAAIATHPGCLHLDMAWHSVDERGVILHSGERLPSLRYIRSMRVRLMDEALLELSLHMPRLEELAVPAVSDEFVAPTVPERLELSCGYNPDHLRAFPALRRLTVAAQRLELVAPAMPVLEELSVTLYSPDADLRALVYADTDQMAPSLTSLVTSMQSRHGEACLTRRDLHASSLEEDGDMSVNSNQLAPLLDAAAPTLRQLCLSIAQEPDEKLERALAAASGLTSLQLRFTDPEWAPQQPAWLDCRLLGGMAQLRQLRIDAGDRLDTPAALAALPLAELALEGPAALPAIAPHAPGLTRLELGGCSAEALHGAEAAVGQALASLAGLRCLVLGGREELSTRRSPETAAEAQGMEERHTAAVDALQALLPAGCEVQAEAPWVSLWGS